MVGGILTPAASTCMDSDAETPPATVAEASFNADDDSDSIITPFYLMDNSSRVASLVAMWEENEQDPDIAGLQLQPSISFDEEAASPTTATNFPSKGTRVHLPQRKQRRSKRKEPERLTIIDLWDRRVNSPPAEYPASTRPPCESAETSTAATSSSSSSTASTPTTTDDELDTSRCQRKRALQRPRRSSRKQACSALPAPDTMHTLHTATRSTPSPIASTRTRIFAPWHENNNSRSDVSVNDECDNNADNDVALDDTAPTETAMCSDFYDDWAMAKARGERNYRNKLRGRNKPFRFRDEPFGVKSFSRKRRTALRQLKNRLHDSEDEHERLPTSLSKQQYHRLYSGDMEGGDVYSVVTHKCQGCSAMFIPSRNQRRNIARAVAQQQHKHQPLKAVKNNAGNSDGNNDEMREQKQRQVRKDCSNNSSDTSSKSTHGKEHMRAEAMSQATAATANASSPHDNNPSNSATIGQKQNTKHTQNKKAKGGTAQSSDFSSKNDEEKKQQQEQSEPRHVDMTMMCPACRRIILQAQRKHRRKGKTIDDEVYETMGLQYPIDLTRVSKKSMPTLLQTLEQRVKAVVSESDLRFPFRSIKRTPVHDDVLDRFLERLSMLRRRENQPRRRVRFRGKSSMQHVQAARGASHGAGDAGLAVAQGVFLRITFHGTPKHNHNSIYRQGLLVPNQGVNGVRVANGSVHGLGIYSSVHPSTARAYARDTRRLFACALIDDSECRHSSVVSRYGAIFVAKDPAHICPLWTIAI